MTGRCITEPPSFRAFPPEKPALIMGDGSVVTFGALEARANCGARALRAMGLAAGDTLALCVVNSPDFFEIVCAARRSGLTTVPISTRLTAGEVAFIVADSGARALIVSPGIEAETAALTALCDVAILATDGAWREACATEPETPLADGSRGREMLYSSGTTGRPKGIVYHTGAGAPSPLSAGSLFGRLGITGESMLLTPAPLYHSAPFSWSMGLVELGGTVVVMAHFDPAQALALIERYRVDVSQWVPTHFVRMLKLPEEARRRYDLSSLRVAIHAAAPCPVPVKRAMIDWWGPILSEYFGSSEQRALTFITSEEWLERPGSVGRCVFGKLHICDEAGASLPVGKTGLIYCEGAMEFSYHNDPGRTAQSRNEQGWTTVGDIGRLDADGYLYLTDRKNFTIISGGVNVYPQEIEDRLIGHPRVADAAVIGAPDDDLGEAVSAVIQTADPADATPAFAEELRCWLRRSLSGVKVPRHILFCAQLPRLPTGKMAKHKLREEVAAAISKRHGRADE